MFSKALVMWKQETLDNNVDHLNHSYSQNKCAFLKNGKNVYSESFFPNNKNLENEFGISKKNFSEQSSIIKPKKAFEKCNSVTDLNISEEEEPLISNKSYQTLNIKVKRPENSQSATQSEESNLPNSKSVMANPFWNNSTSSANNKTNDKESLRKENKKVIISKFKHNPGIFQLEFK